MKKNFKVNPIKSALLRNMPPLSGSIYAFGKIKSGKTTLLLNVSQSYHDNQGYKIVDMFGGLRKEQNYWCLPSNDLDYWERVKKILNIDPKVQVPKQYKVNLLYPLFINELPDKLPTNPGFVKSKIFTIPLKDIELNDIKCTINGTGNNTTYLLEELKNNLGKKDGGAFIYNKVKDMESEKQVIWKNFFKPLIEEQLLQSEVCGYNLDVKKEMKDRETITVLCLDFCPAKFQLLIIEWFMKKVKELLDAGDIPIKNIFLFREVSEFFRVTAVTEDRIVFFKDLLSTWMRYARWGIHVMADCQSQNEVRGVVEGQSDLTFLGRVAGTSRRDRNEIKDSLGSSGKMTTKQIDDLSNLRSGEFYLIENYKDARKVYLLLPKTRYWREGDGSFFNLWTKIVDKWEDISADKEEVLKKFMEEKELLEEERKAKEREKEEKRQRNRSKGGRPAKKEIIEEKEEEDNNVDKEENIDYIEEENNENKNKQLTNDIDEEDWV